MDKLGKIGRHHWKERLRIGKIAKFESELLKTNKDGAFKLQRVYSAGLLFYFNRQTQVFRVINTLLTKRHGRKLSFMINVSLNVNLERPLLVILIY